MQNTIIEIQNILNKHTSYTAYRMHIKKQFSEIDAKLANSEYKYAEALYLFVHQLDNRPLCKYCSNELKYIDRTAGYGEYCSHKCYVSAGCGKEARRKTNIEKYGCENALGNKTIRVKRKLTMIEKFGSEFPLQNEELRKKSIATYKKSNQIDIQKKRKDTMQSNYGVDSIWKIPGIEQKRKDTNIKKYGVEYAMQLPEVASQGVATRIANGSNRTSKNSSMEATIYIRQYIKDNNYSIDQVAYTDKETGLYEWGTYFNNRWNMFDLTVFEPGYRGNVDHIIEVLEYHGPFHYTEKDVEEKGNLPATPWKNCKITVNESFSIDESKRNFLKERNISLTEIKPERYWSLRT